MLLILLIYYDLPNNNKIIYLYDLFVENIPFLFYLKMMFWVFVLPS